MHFITGKHLSRRTFLRGAGATVALPTLDAMVPAGRVWRDAAAEAGSTRLICVEEVMGTAGSCDFGLEQGLFVPETMGRNFELGPNNSLLPLEDLRELDMVLKRRQGHELTTGMDSNSFDLFLPLGFAASVELAGDKTQQLILLVDVSGDLTLILVTKGDIGGGIHIA